MSFKLPASLATFVNQAVTLKLADTATLRCRWPSVRDVAWASGKADAVRNGTAVANNLYASHLIAASLIGVSDDPVDQLVDDPVLKDLLTRDASTLTDEEHAHISEQKYRSIIMQIPGDLIVLAYNRDMSPWLLEKAGQVKKTPAEEVEMQRVKAALEMLEAPETQEEAPAE